MFRAQYSNILTEKETLGTIFIKLGYKIILWATETTETG